MHQGSRINQFSFYLLRPFDKSHQMKRITFSKRLILLDLLYLSHLLIPLNLALAPYLMLFKLRVILPSAVTCISALIASPVLSTKPTGYPRPPSALLHILRSC